jgi:uncharacterized membrane protein
MVRLAEVWDRLRGGFWFTPALFSVLAVALAGGLLMLDAQLGAPDGTRWLYAGSAEGARSLLSALAGSMITVVGLAFSITIVSLQLASAQLGPRLLRNFVRDPGNQVVLGAFVATFVYCLVVLRTVRGQDGAVNTFVPHVAVTGAVVLALLSIGLLIYFIHHASTSIQADQAVVAVARDLDAGIDHLFPERLGQEEPPVAPVPHPDADAPSVTAKDTGYVTGIDGDALLRAARDAGAVIHLVHRPGQFIIAGEVIARVVAPPTEVTDAFAGTVSQAVLVGPARTFIQDILFGIEQLVEIAVRALASGYTDPTTALRCIDYLGAAVTRVARRRLPSAERRDETGALRLVVPTLGLEDFVTAAFTPIRLQGAGNRAVAVRLLETFGRIATLADQRALHRALLAEAVRIRGVTAQTFAERGDRATVYAAFETFLRTIRTDVRRTADDPAAA